MKEITVRRKNALAFAVALHLMLPLCTAQAHESAGGIDVQTESVDVEANAAKEDAKYESQSTNVKW